MRIAILSDIHDHLAPLEVVLETINRELVDVMICCGDLCSPFIVSRLGQAFSGEIHLVFGNNDADTFRITRIAAQWNDRMHLYGEVGFFSLGGKKFAINHFDQIARELAASGNFDVVCFGHNHIRELTRFTTRGHEVQLINPGTLMGYRFDQGKPQEVPATFAIMDLDEEEVQFWEVRFDHEEEPGWMVLELSDKKNNGKKKTD